MAQPLGEQAAIAFEPLGQVSQTGEFGVAGLDHRFDLPVALVVGQQVDEPELQRQDEFVEAGRLGADVGGEQARQHLPPFAGHLQDLVLSLRNFLAGRFDQPLVAQQLDGFPHQFQRRAGHPADEIPDLARQIAVGLRAIGENAESAQADGFFRR